MYVCLAIIYYNETLFNIIIFLNIVNLLSRKKYIFICIINKRDKLYVYNAIIYGELLDKMVQVTLLKLRKNNCNKKYYRHCK